MANLQALAVIFRHFNSATSRFEEVRVPMDEILAYHAKTHEWVEQIEWADGSRSWGKSWLFSLDDDCICRIGAGAYGDAEVWRHPDYDQRSMVKRCA